MSGALQRLHDTPDAVLFARVARLVERGDLASAVAILALWLDDLQRETTSPAAAQCVSRCCAAAVILAYELATLKDIAAEAEGAT